MSPIHARRAGWEEHLASYLLAHEHTPFAWGEWDCVGFAAGAVEAITGHRLALPVRAWRNEDEARAILTDLGGLQAAVDLVLPRVDVHHAQRGDIVLAVHSGVTWLGVCDGARAWCLSSAGRKSISVAHVMWAWAVGREPSRHG